MRTCYVSMPSGRRPLDVNSEDGSIASMVFDWDAFYEDSIKPTLKSLGVDCFRDDEVSGTAVIHKAQLSAIMNSDIMVADVTKSNPNVMYEIGLRHAINPGPTIVMFNRHTAFSSVPYDLLHIFLLRYTARSSELTAEESREFRNELSEAVEVSLKHGRKYQSPLYDLFPDLHVDRPREPCVFIGHGRSKLWARLQVFLEKELNLSTVTYESESRVGESIVPVLDAMLRQATFAVLVLTGEDETAEGARRARQNVVHEAGLFQGVLGFRRAVMLLQKGAEDFSNVAGLQHIEFEKDNIETTFWEIQRVLRREGLI